MAGNPKKKQAETGFHSVLADGGPTPESIMIAVMRGEDTIRKPTIRDGKDVGGAPYVITQKMIDAAEKLLPYRLPKLNAVDQVNRNVEMTHEDWINSIDNEGDE